MKTDKKQRVIPQQVYLPNYLHRRLKKAARERGVSMSAIVREAIRSAYGSRLQ